ncbi:hypothetical protein [Methylobacterium goesingense]|uniref:Phasin domain-containing protein n=1 Tax=Methylobacterium goesingense TaxID=243690 RepID=A0ABV2KZY8_9HYPH|nr:hypothetical protein [Methylobacterium goesingense]GJD73179.1 hypothetical protein CFIICLFH_1405 [Methylobacterium goesingense]
MSSNEPESDPALRRAEAARDAVAEAIEATLERLAAVGRSARADVDADLLAARRLMARNTRRQLAANLTLVQGLMEARTLPAMLKLQQDFLRRQMDWAMRDWDLARTQTLALLAEGRGPAEDGPDPVPPSPGEPEAAAPEPPAPSTDPA